LRFRPWFRSASFHSGSSSPCLPDVRQCLRHNFTLLGALALGAPLPPLCLLPWGFGLSAALTPFPFWGIFSSVGGIAAAGLTRLGPLFPVFLSRPTFFPASRGQFFPWDSVISSWCPILLFASRRSILFSSFLPWARSSFFDDALANYLSHSLSPLLVLVLFMPSRAVLPERNALVLVLASGPAALLGLPLRSVLVLIGALRAASRAACRRPVHWRRYTIPARLPCAPGLFHAPPPGGRRLFPLAFWIRPLLTRVCPFLLSPTQPHPPRGPLYGSRFFIRLRPSGLRRPTPPAFRLPMLLLLACPAPLPLGGVLIFMPRSGLAALTLDLRLSQPSSPSFPLYRLCPLSSAA